MRIAKGHLRSSKKILRIFKGLRRMNIKVLGISVLYCLILLSVCAIVI